MKKKKFYTLDEVLFERIKKIKTPKQFRVFFDAYLKEHDRLRDKTKQTKVSERRVKAMKIFLDNISTSLKGRGGKSRGTTFYLDAIKELGMDREFAKLEVFCTDGDIRPPYPYQWRATSTTLVGDDDPFEGFGETPLEALRNLYAQMKEFKKNPPEQEENI